MSNMKLKKKIGKDKISSEDIHAPFVYKIMENFRNRSFLNPMTFVKKNGKTFPIYPPEEELQKRIINTRNLTQGPYQGYWSQGNSDLDDVTPLFSRLNAAWRDKFREKYYYKKNFEFQETLADLKPLVDRAE